jgi:hypothetical protein
VAVCAAVLALPAFAQKSDDRYSTFFMGRVKYGQRWNDCRGVGKNLAKLVSQVSTIHIKEEQDIALTQPQLFETPFLFMNGHYDFVLSDDERENLRTYFAHGGFLLTSGCCTNPDFPKAWRREFGKLFPNETVKRLPYDHPIYRSFYKVERVRSLHEKRDIYLEGLFYRGRLVAVLCEDGLCCAFSMDNSCNVGRGIAPEDGKKLALNIAVYALVH